MKKVNINNIIGLVVGPLKLNRRLSINKLYKRIRVEGYYSNSGSSFLKLLILFVNVFLTKTNR